MLDRGLSSRPLLDLDTNDNFVSIDFKAFSLISFILDIFQFLYDSTKGICLWRVYKVI